MEFTLEQRQEALDLFNELVEKGFTPAQRNEGDRDYTVSREFKEVDETLFVPHLKGG
jgi:hypothetical protein